MPKICEFLGIIVYMYYNDDTQHFEPHFHVKYSGYEAAISVDGDILAGSIPEKQLKIIIGWAAAHEEELYANWARAIKGEKIEKISPNMEEK